MNSEQKGHGRQHSWRNKRYYFGIILDILQEIMLTSIKTVSLSTAVSMQLTLHDKTIFPCPKQMRQLQVSPVSQCPFPTCSTLRSLYTGCPRRNEQNFGRVFLMLNSTDITQNTYIQFYTPSVTPYSSTAHARQRDIVMQ